MQRNAREGEKKNGPVCQGGIPLACWSFPRNGPAYGRTPEWSPRKRGGKGGKYRGEVFTTGTGNKPERPLRERAERRRKERGILWRFLNKDAVRIRPKGNGARLTRLDRIVAKEDPMA